jgi:molecular chaperone DnaK
VEKDTGEWGDKVSEGTRGRLDSAVEKAKEALKGDDLPTLNSARDELVQAFSAAGQEMYQAQTAEAGGAGEPAAGAEEAAEPAAGARPGADEDVVEADYEIVDEEK